jgi:hypothetical protein
VKLAVAYADAGGEITWPEVEAFPTQAPGLLAHRALDADEWVISHHSGVAVAVWAATSAEYALAAAGDLAGVTDWTVSGKQLAGIARSIGPDVRRITRRWGGVIKGPAVAEGVLT